VWANEDLVGLYSNSTLVHSSSSSNRLLSFFSDLHAFTPWPAPELLYS
jgi:hypothetical protein